METALDKIRTELDVYWATHHTPPTMDELRELSGLPSKSHVSFLLDKLVKEGYVRKHRTKYIPLWVDELFEKGE